MYCERTLIQNVLEGNGQAFERLLAPHEQRLLRIARNIVRTHQDAEDVLQEARLKAYCKLSTFRGECSFETWLTAIVINQGRLYLRQPAKRRLTPITPTLERVCRSNAESSLQRLIENEKATTVESSVAALPAIYRNVLHLRLTNSTITEGSQALSISKTAYKSRFFRALRQLRRDINRGNDCSQNRLRS